jgi:hypothetical protein
MIQRFNDIPLPLYSTVQMEIVGIQKLIGGVIDLSVNGMLYIVMKMIPLKDLALISTI